MRTTNNKQKQQTRKGSENSGNGKEGFQQDFGIASGGSISPLQSHFDSRGEMVP